MFVTRLGGFLKRSLVVIVATVSSFLIVACMTAAQRQLISMRDGVQMTSARFKSCTQTITNNPGYEVIATRTPLDGVSQPSLAQLASEDIATDEEVTLITSIHNQLAPCREQAIQDLMKIVPGVVPIIVQGYYNFDLITVDLIKRKITWGEGNKRRVAVRNNVMAKLQQAGAQLDRELRASHEAELAQRQRAFEALSQWAYQQQVLLQNQQLINSLNRPVITNCSGSAYSIQCTSY